MNNSQKLQTLIEKLENISNKLIILTEDENISVIFVNYYKII